MVRPFLSGFGVERIVDGNLVVRFKEPGRALVINLELVAQRVADRIVDDTLANGLS
jgi:hypothetical protein